MAAKKPKLIRALFTTILFIGCVYLNSIGHAETLTFTWDANHSRENVRAYNIYWFTSSSIYGAFDLEDILEALWNGEIVYGSESIDINSDPKLEKYEPNKYRYTLTIDASSKNKFYYFVCTAVDKETYESYFSDTAIWKNPYFEDEGESGGGGGGGCFFRTIFNFK